MSFPSKPIHTLPPEWLDPLGHTQGGPVKERSLAPECLDPLGHTQGNSNVASALVGPKGPQESEGDSNSSEPNVDLELKDVYRIYAGCPENCCTRLPFQEVYETYGGHESREVYDRPENQ